MAQFAGVGIFLLFALLFGLVAMLMVRILSPKKPTPEKLLTYECGLDTVGPTWVRFRTSYFIYALLFVAFDVESVFLYPWAVEFTSLGLVAFIEMVIFIGLLLLALWYAWKEGVLEWI